MMDGVFVSIVCSLIEMSQSTADGGRVQSTDTD